MIELFEQDVKTIDRQSSKGNQLKWSNSRNWYKADYTGYEGLAEYVISHLLKDSSLAEEEYILYETEEMMYHRSKYLGCYSKDFLPKGWQLITLERLFKNVYNESLNNSIYKISDVGQRLRFLVEQTVRITGLKDFGAYMSKMLTLDAFFLNEDRHTHNIAVLLDEKGAYRYCPFFDNGAALLSDTTMDYPIGEDVLNLMRDVKAKTFSTNFDEQLDVAEQLYGQHVKFRFTIRDLERLLDKEPYYPTEIKERIIELLRYQRQKYQYLF
ncbi:MAG: hypothetical protein E7261_06350 [Lachnospiraceae bacterium]|nr:hypothetical protein [Lachnospiraceae bacterium]